MEPKITWVFFFFLPAQREITKAQVTDVENVCSVIHLLYWFPDIRIQCLNYNWLVSLPFYWDHWFERSGSLYSANQFCGEGMSKCHYKCKKKVTVKKIVHKNIKRFLGCKLRLCGERRSSSLSENLIYGAKAKLMYVYSLLIKSCVFRPLCANQNTETLCIEAPHESMCPLI